MGRQLLRTNRQVLVRRRIPSAMGVVTPGQAGCQVEMTTDYCTYSGLTIIYHP